MVTITDTKDNAGYPIIRVSLYGSKLLPVSPRSGIETRAGLKNLVQNLVQLRAERTPISPLGSSLLR